MEAELALKSGGEVMHTVLADYGILIAFIAFIVIKPLAHFTIGLLLALGGFFIPKLPDEAREHQVKVGATSANIELKGNSRTVMMGLGVLIIILSVIEGVARSGTS